MWIAKVKLLDSNCVFATKHKKYYLQSYEQALTHYKKGKSYFFMSSHILIGSLESKRKYLAELKKDKRVKKLDVNGDLTIELIEKKSSDMDLSVYKSFYNPEIILTKPGFVDSDGWEYYEFASWNREAINKIISAVEKNYQGQLLKLKETKKYDIYMPKILPKLSDKQKEAISIAVKEGYYNFPRKIELKDLAKLSKLSFSTFREHLRRAENKILPLMYRDYILK
ncbi:MAG: helix-turn-helix domain-containing protein [Nanoarchaeota archaeon]|nr:helix-turn-helix domain-containing protein [Nanoarchaeota archaeon]